MDAKRKAAIEKVCKLAEMTTERGCTQAEQDLATERARELIARHDLTLEELEAAARNGGIAVEPQPEPVAQPVGDGFYGVRVAHPYFNVHVHTSGNHIIISFG